MSKNQVEKQQDQSYVEGRNYGHAATQEGVAIVRSNDPDFNRGVQDGVTLANDGRAADGSRQV